MEEAVVTMRTKSAVVIVLIVFAVTAASYFSSLSFTNQSLTETMEQDLSLALDIADSLVSTTIGLIKSNAATVAERLLKGGSAAEITEIMAAQM